MRSSSGASFRISSIVNLRGLATSPSTETDQGEVTNLPAFRDGPSFSVPDSSLLLYVVTESSGVTFSSVLNGPLTTPASLVEAYARDEGKTRFAKLFPANAKPPANPIPYRNLRRSR